MLLEPRKAKDLGHGRFPALPLSQAVLQNLSATGVSTNEQGELSIVGGHTVPSPLQHSGPSICNAVACLSLPDLQPLTKIPTAGLSRASGAVFFT